MLRPRKKYTVYDLQQLKGKRCLTHIHVKSPEEAAAAEEAGVDLMSCSFDSSGGAGTPAPPRRRRAAQLPLLRHAARTGLAGGGDPRRLPRPRTRRQLRLLLRQPLHHRGHGARRHPRRRSPRPGSRATSHGRATAPSADPPTEALRLHQRMKDLENAGAYAAELEVVPHNLAALPLLADNDDPHVTRLRQRLRHAVPLLRRHPRRLRRTHPPRTPRPTATSPPNTAASSRNASPPSANTSTTCTKTAFPSLPISSIPAIKSSTKPSLSSGSRSNRLDCRARKCVSRPCGACR